MESIEDLINQTQGTPTDALQKALTEAEENEWSFVVVVAQTGPLDGYRVLGSGGTLAQLFGMLDLGRDMVLERFRQLPTDEYEE